MDRKAQSSAPLEHRYSPRAAYVAGLRALAGIAGSAALWGVAGGLTIGLISLAAIAVFLAYGVIAVRRSKDVLVLSDTSIVVNGWRRRIIEFDQMTVVRLAYYSTRRDGEKGWMELTVKAGGQRLMIESEIDDFNRIATAIYDAAINNTITLSPVSQRNFAVLLDDSVSIGQKTGYAVVRAAR